VIYHVLSLSLDASPLSPNFSLPPSLNSHLESPFKHLSLQNTISTSSIQFPNSPILPHRVKTQLKDRIKAARNGHSLLKRKSDAIKMRLHVILSKIKQVKLDVGQGMIEAAESHDNAVWAAGDFNHTVIEGVTDASFRIKADIINVAGVTIPKFERALDELGGQANQTTMVGFSRGGEQVQKCKSDYSKVLDNLVQLAVLQTSLQALDHALKVTNRRVNALEFILIPQLENTLVYVDDALFEAEREDAYRVKKVKDTRTAEAEKELEEEDRIRDEHEAKMSRLSKQSPKQQQQQQQQPEHDEQEAPSIAAIGGAVEKIIQDSAREDAAIADLF